LPFRIFRRSGSDVSLLGHRRGFCVWLFDLDGGVSSEANGGTVTQVASLPTGDPEHPTNAIPWSRGGPTDANNGESCKYDLEAVEACSPERLDPLSRP
jgi:hypothetical protein